MHWRERERVYARSFDSDRRFTSRVPAEGPWRAGSVVAPAASAACSAAHRHSARGTMSPRTTCAPSCPSLSAISLSMCYSFTQLRIGTEIPACTSYHVMIRVLFKLRTCAMLASVATISAARVRGRPGPRVHPRKHGRLRRQRPQRQRPGGWDPTARPRPGWQLAMAARSRGTGLGPLQCALFTTASTYLR